MKKTVLITGGSKGIGKECVLLFARSKLYNVAFTYFSNKKNAFEVKKQAESNNVDVECIKTDVSKKSEIEKMINKTIDRFGYIDVLVNNAGVTEIKEIDKITEKDWDTMLDTNLKSMFFCSQKVFEHMKKRKKGTIINISSQAGISGGIIVGAHYSISKAGVLALTKTFAKLGARYNIRVNTVSPGVIDTDMTKKFPKKEKEKIIGSIPLKRMGKPSEVAEIILFLSSDKSSYVTGANIQVNGGILMN